ncbi:DUF551 domain-containing protein [Klebsiella variicola]|uniref:DUF551 domain-containing protein n=1 Tax=Klebsiella variicola TaxID=244366 RepID=UPI0035A94BCB
MTKSTITDERVTSVIERLEHYACNLKWTNVRGAQDLLTAADGLRELQERRKADSEPVAYTDERNLGYIDRGRETAYLWGKQNSEAGDIQLYRHAQQPVVPATLPCSVELKPGLIIGKGCKTETLLTALRRRADYNAEIDAMTPEERAEYDANIEAFKAMLPQPAPTVPQDVLDALQKVARIRLDLNDFDGDRRGIADCLGDAEEALIEVVNRRAAMLAAAPQLPGSEPAIVPGKWIPVSERMPESNGVYFGWDGKRVLEVNCFFGGFSANQFIHGEITHWMQLPAPPTEVK